MSAAALSLTQEQLHSIVTAHVDRVLTPDLLTRLAAEHTAQRCARLTLDEAMKHLRCPSRAELIRVCAARRIPILRETRKRSFILLRDIEAADARIAALPGATTPTVLAREAA